MVRLRSVRGLRGSALSGRGRRAQGAGEQCADGGRPLGGLRPQLCRSERGTPGPEGQGVWEAHKGLYVPMRKQPSLGSNTAVRVIRIFRLMHGLMGSYPPPLVEAPGKSGKGRSDRVPVLGQGRTSCLG